MSERHLRPVVPIKAEPAVLDRLRAECADALHSYVVAACDYDLKRAAVIYNRVNTTLEGQLNPTAGDAA